MRLHIYRQRFFRGGSLLLLRTCLSRALGGGSVSSHLLGRRVTCSLRRQLSSASSQKGECWVESSPECSLEVPFVDVSSVAFGCVSFVDRDISLKLSCLGNAIADRRCSRREPIRAARHLSKLLNSIAAGLCLLVETKISKLFRKWQSTMDPNT